MPEIIALFSVLISTFIRNDDPSVIPSCPCTACDDRARNNVKYISRWTGQGGSYRTVQRFFNTVIPWTTICWIFFRTYLLDRESDYILVGDETVRAKSGNATYCY